MTNSNRRKATETIPAVAGLIAIPKDCLSCSNSMSTDNNKLVCVNKKEHIIVTENEVCDDYA